MAYLLPFQTCLILKGENFSSTFQLSIGCSTQETAKGGRYISTHKLELFQYSLIDLAFLSNPWSFSGSTAGKESACSAGDLGFIPGWEDALEEGMAAHSSILAWRIPWTEEPGRLQSTGQQRVGHDRSDLAQHSTSNPTFPFC